MYRVEKDNSCIKHEIDDLKVISDEVVRSKVKTELAVHLHLPSVTSYVMNKTERKKKFLKLKIVSQV